MFYFDDELDGVEGDDDLLDPGDEVSDEEADDDVVGGFEEEM
jgi:hypothetical protein